MWCAPCLEQYVAMAAAAAAMALLVQRIAVKPGGALDAETRRRGQTFYTPDGRIPLHPEVISEEAGSLLAGQLCAAFVWDFELDAAAEVTSVLVRRARCAAARSSTTRVSRRSSTPAPRVPCCSSSRKSGIKRVELERRRGGASLNMPRTGDRAAARRRLPDCRGAAAAGGGLECADFADDRDGRRRD